MFNVPTMEYKIATAITKNVEVTILTNKFDSFVIEFECHLVQVVRKMTLGRLRKIQIS